MNRLYAAFVLVFLSACGGGNSEPPPPPPPPGPTAIELFTQSIQNLTLTDFYPVSFGGLLGRSP